MVCFVHFSLTIDVHHWTSWASTLRSAAGQCRKPCADFCPWCHVETLTSFPGRNVHMQISMKSVGVSFYPLQKSEIKQQIPELKDFSKLLKRRGLHVLWDHQLYNLNYSGSKSLPMAPTLSLLTSLVILWFCDSNSCLVLHMLVEKKSKLLFPFSVHSDASTLQWGQFWTTVLLSFIFDILGCFT